MLVSPSKIFNIKLLIPNYINLTFFLQNNILICNLETFLISLKFEIPPNICLKLKKTTLHCIGINYNTVYLFKNFLITVITSGLFLFKKRFYFKGIGYKVSYITQAENIFLKIAYGYSHKLKYKLASNIIIKPLTKKKTFFELLSFMQAPIASLIHYLHSARKPFVYKRKGFFVLGQQLNVLKKK